MPPVRTIATIYKENHTLPQLIWIFFHFNFGRESRIKGIGDALGVDWASLVEESKAMMQEKLLKCETSAKQQWNPNRILLDIGVSYKMGGGEFAQDTLLNAYETLKQDGENDFDEKADTACNDNHLGIKIKTEIGDDGEPITESKVNGKYEVSRPGQSTEPGLHLHPLPCVQRSAQNITNKLNRLVFNASGPYSRGLCTRRDIALRRQLCNLAVNESNCKTNNGKSAFGYENIALKLFQKAVKTWHQTVTIDDSVLPEQESIEKHYFTWIHTEDVSSWKFDLDTEISKFVAIILVFSLLNLGLLFEKVYHTHRLNKNNRWFSICFLQLNLCEYK